MLSFEAHLCLFSLKIFIVILFLVIVSSIYQGHVNGPRSLGNAFGPLNLAPPLHVLDGSRRNFPKFIDDEQHPNEHIVAHYIACGVHSVGYEDVSIRLFVETLQGVVVDWFYHRPPHTITN